MSFILPDLVVESVIRDGLANLVKRPELIENIFQSLTSPYNRRKYGVEEVNTLKNWILTNQIAVVHSFAEAAAKAPCFSIQLGSDTEDRRLALLGDFAEDEQTEFTDPQDLEELVVVPAFIAQSYDPRSGQVYVADNVDLSKVYPNLLFVDGSGVEFTIKAGISNVDGNKFFTLEKGATPDLDDLVHIKSSLNFEQYEINSITSDVTINIGVHSKNALTTKYLYILLKYFLASRKQDLLKRCFFVSSHSGSDFNREFEYQGDMVYNRFMTVSGKVEDSWRGDEVDLIDNVEVTTIPKG